jgi:hypothetical protein
MARRRRAQRTPPDDVLANVWTAGEHITQSWRLSIVIGMRRAKKANRLRVSQQSRSHFHGQVALVALCSARR